MAEFDCHAWQVIQAVVPGAKSLFSNVSAQKAGIGLTLHFDVSTVIT